MKKRSVFTLAILLCIQPIFAQKKLPKDLCVSAKEYRLYQLINTLRTINDMPSIELSASMTQVAHLHVADLNNHHPDTSICNLHSWSDKGEWTSCCYQKYVLKQECMWGKPKELTPYKYRGYELAYADPEGINPDSLMMLWMKVSKVQDMLLNKGAYEKKKWLAIGVGIQDEYAVVWFAQVKDKAAIPKLCINEKIITDNKNKAASLAKVDKPKRSTKEALVIRNKTGKYYIIFGSYDRLKDAERQIKKYFKAGFVDAKIVINRDKIRISLSDHPDLDTAKAAKKKLAKVYNDAWIIKY